jgi:hypothetical protein
MRPIENPSAPNFVAMAVAFPGPNPTITIVFDMALQFCHANDGL